MIKTFDELCAVLGLSLSLAYEDAERLSALERWCDENISRDIHYVGRHQDRYERYLALAQQYLDDFLAYVPVDLTIPVPQFEQLTTIQCAAWHGYDRFMLASAPIASEALNQSNAAGMTPLHMSAANGYVHTSQVLLAQGADPHQINHESQLPIHSALFVPLFHDAPLISNKETIFRALIAFAPETIEHKDNSGDTVFQLMAAHGFYTIMAEMLSKYTKGAFIDNNRSKYPIHTAILNNQIACASLLLKIDGVATLADAKQRVALHYAARYGTRDMVQHCCGATTDLNLRDTSLKTPLLLAAEAGNIDAVQTLVEYGADPTLVDYLGYSLLHYAVLAKDKALVLWVLDNTDIDVNHADAKGDPPLYFCQEKYTDDEIAQLLVSRGATVSGRT